jgi:4-alpha-glucanotransferase
MFFAARSKPFFQRTSLSGIRRRMKILFRIPYRTDFGDHMVVVGSLPQLGSGNALQGLELTYLPDKGLWTGDIRLLPGESDPFDYRYVIANENREILHGEGGKNRILKPHEFLGHEMIELRDYWRPPDDANDIFETIPFREVIFKRRASADSPVPTVPKAEEAARLRQGFMPSIGGNDLKESPSSATHGNQEGFFLRIQVSAACVYPGQRLFLTGDIPLLGVRNFQGVIPMHPGRYPYWEAELVLDQRATIFSYRYASGNTPEDLITGESGEARLFLRDISGANDEHRAMIITDWPFRYPDGPWKGAGIAIPVFSIRTGSGLGVGEFADLKLLADWAKRMGFKMIQLLPINDTSAYGTWYDSYPYSIISAFALHPIYIHLSELAVPHTPLAREIAVQAERLNKNPSLDYEEVMAVKKALLKKLFQEDALRDLESPAFQDFFREHAHWLRPYAAFCHLRDRYGTSDHRLWGEDSLGTPEVIDRLTAPEGSHYPDIAFPYYIQFHLHRQLSEASAYAHKQGVIIKGDIPMGVAKGSVDTWINPEWFHMNNTAGAPPDDFAEEGQNWGFPTYNWESMAADDYSWWRRRLNHLGRYFDAVRLDHIIGFLRIWTIPDDSLTALKGRFYPALPVTRAELEKNGIDDIARLCEPCITDEILEQLFGNDAKEVIRIYLDERKRGRYRFKSAFSTQRQVAAHMDEAYQDHRNDKAVLQKRLYGLLRLFDDVILIPDRPGDQTQFHPRIFMEKTFSYKSLDEKTRDFLHDLYQDYFFKRQEEFWRASGWEKLSALVSATEMLICGEDLGMVPACVPEVLEKLNILSLRIQRMPVAVGELFGDPATYPYLSVASPGSHDMSTIRGWWEETDRAVIQVFYHNILGRRGIAPKTCDPLVCREIIDLHQRSRSLWAVIPVQDLLGMSADLRQANPLAERINDPATPHHNWDFRLHRSLEDLCTQTTFIAQVREMIRATRGLGR